MKISNLVAARSPHFWPLLLTLLLAALFSQLAVRAHDEFHWSDWGFGDAQTMLSLRQWQEGGWIKNHLLFNPHGYGKVSELLDDPALRQHAHGISPTSSPKVGPRLLYTHYPAGYLIPYALLSRLGLDQVFPLRLLSLLFSTGALILMYQLFARLTSAKVSVLAVLFYAASTSFLGYADTLANQPLDDLLRFAFLLAVVLADDDAPSRRRFWLLAAWTSEFCLSLASFDSVFFLYLWLVGWDLLRGHGWRWRRYLLFALAPLAAHGLQFLQNCWYLGQHDALQDILYTFVAKSHAPPGSEQGSLIFHALTNCFELIYNPAFFLLPLLALYLLGWYRLSPATRLPLPAPRLLLLLFCCGLAFLLLLPHAAHMAYEGRQMIPAVSLLVSGFSWLVLDGWRHRGETTKRGPWRQGYLLLSSLILIIFWSGFLLFNRYQEETPEFFPDLLLAREIKAIPTAYEPVYFDLLGFANFLNPAYMPGYPQIQPMTEYYAGRPILSFSHPALLTDDLVTLVHRSREKFSPVIVTDSQERMTTIVNFLALKGLLRTSPTTFTVQRDKFILDLTPYLLWATTK